MLKKLIVYVVPFLIPFVVYGIYVLLSKKHRKAALNVVPWLWLTLAGFILCLLTILFFVFTDAQEPGAEYIPPRVIDGQIKPGQFRERE